MRKERSGRLEIGVRGKLCNAGDAKAARRAVLWMMGVSTVCVMVAVMIGYWFEPERVARRTFETLAVKYYEQYFYPRFVKSVAEERFEERMGFYGQVGVQDVTLQQVLAYNMGQNRGYEKYFTRKGFMCDKKETYAKFFPEEPYEAGDYRVEYHYACRETD